MENADKIKAMLSAVAAGETADSETVAAAVKAMPYATAVWMAALRTPGAVADIDTARARVVLGCSDTATIGAASAGDAWTEFYPPQKPESHATDDVIDTFLRTYGNTSPEEEALLEKMIFNPTPDYGEILAREEQENLPAAPADPASDDGRIAAFILSHHPATQTPEAVPAPAPGSDTDSTPVAPPAKAADDSLLSEALAAVFVKQHRYERAYDIISSLNLKFPKKSAYFADQLRFLRKVIVADCHARGVQPPDFKR